MASFSPGTLGGWDHGLMDIRLGDQKKGGEVKMADKSYSREPPMMV